MKAIPASATASVAGGVTDHPLPFFSVIIPTYCRLGPLRHCLQALARLRYPRDRFEVLVVDDGSPASPLPLIERFRTRVAVTLLTQAHAGPATARNTGACDARGQFLAFTDDDCEPAPDWLRALAARCAASPEVAFGGRTVNGLPHSPYATATHRLVTACATPANTDPHRAGFFPSNNLTVPAEQFRATGGFDPAFPFAAGEDREFCARWRRHGYSLQYAPEAVVRHLQALTWWGFWQKHFTYGRGAYALRVASPGGAAARRSYAHLLHAALPPRRYPRRWAVTALLTLAQVATVAGVCWEWRCHGLTRFPRGAGAAGEMLTFTPSCILPLQGGGGGERAPHSGGMEPTAGAVAG